jgi:hypothetical protein
MNLLHSPKYTPQLIKSVPKLLTSKYSKIRYKKNHPKTHQILENATSICLLLPVIKWKIVYQQNKNPAPLIDNCLNEKKNYGYENFPAPPPKWK